MRHTLRAALLPACLGLLLASAGCATVAPPEPAPPPPAVLATPLPAPAPEPAAAAPEPELSPDIVLPAGPTPPRGRLDPAQDAERASLWDRVRGGFAMPDLEGDRVAKWEQFYARQPDYVQRMVTRGGRYLFHIVEEVDKRGMPAELALLPFIESAFNPQAMSRTRASGMWQFMPGTGKDFELRQNVFRDDRRDVLASTRAALDYLQRLHGLFGDWHLALAAYNWGQGNVQRALDRNRRAGLPQDYLSLRMPEETRDYVPKLQAIKNIVSAPERLGLALPPLENHPYFLGVGVERDIDVVLAARLAGLSLDDFQALNPQLNKPVILAAGTPQVLLPYDNANRFIQELPTVQGPLASWTAWVAPKSLKPAEAAKLVGMSEAQLREVNLIPPRMIVRAGSTLLVPRGAHATADVAEDLADHATMLLTPEGRALRRVTVKAGKNGDSVAAVARRYKISPAQVAEWNHVGEQAHFKAGQSITLMLAQPAHKVAQAAPRGKAKAGAATRKPAKAAPRTRVAQAQRQAAPR
jgi:membrane-bound lytic murein transglycosylase D